MISKLSMNDVIMLIVSVIGLSKKKKKKERKKENVEIHPHFYRKPLLTNFHI